MDSRWCPWEIGYADGKKPIESIFVIQTQDDAGRNYGNEYLGLYRSIEVSDAGRIASWRPGYPKNGVFLNSL